MFRAAGSYAAISLDAMRRAEHMQALALEEINHKYKVESDEVDPLDMTLDQFINLLETTPEDELNAQFRQYLEPLLDQIMQGQSNGGSV